MTFLKSFTNLCLNDGEIGTFVTRPIKMPPISLLICKAITFFNFNYKRFYRGGST